jgi:outer membrane lipoprotein SlyB
VLFFAGVVALVASGCVSSSRKPVYDSSQIGQIIREDQGEIIGVREVVIKAPSSRAGSPGVGSRMGGAAAAAAITGNPVAVAVAAGQMIGSAAGAVADNQRGEELTIVMRDGRTVMIVQELGEVPFVLGDRVKILSGSGTSIYGGAATHVVRDDAPAKAY